MLYSHCAIVHVAACHRVYSGDSNWLCRCIYFQCAFAVQCAPKCIYLTYVRSNALDFKLYAFCVSMSNACHRDMKTQLNGNYLDFFLLLFFALFFILHACISSWICSMYLSIVFISTQHKYFNLHLFASQSFSWNVAVLLLLLFIFKPFQDFGPLALFFQLKTYTNTHTHSFELQTVDKISMLEKRVIRFVTFNIFFVRFFFFTMDSVFSSPQQQRLNSFCCCCCDVSMIVH